MSLEAALLENTATLRELITHLSGVKAANDDTAKKPALTVVGTPTAAKTEKAQAIKTEAVKAEPVKESPSEKAKVLTFDDVRIPFVAMASKKGSPVVVALLAEFGVDAAKGGKLSAIPSEKWPEVLVAIQKASA